MQQLFHDYGAAIGPTVAFVLAVVMLWVKSWFDRHSAWKNADRRLGKIANMLKQSPPPEFLDPSKSSNQVGAMLQNAVNVARFYDHMAAVEGALKSAEVPTHEHAGVETIMRFHRLQQSLQIMLDERKLFRRPTPESSPIPGYDNFFNVTQAWKSMLAAAADPQTPSEP